MESKQIKIKTLAVSVLAVLVVEGISRTRLFQPSLLVIGMARLIQIASMVCIVKAMGGDNDIIGLACSQWARGLRKGLLWSAAFGAIALCAFVLLSLAGMNVFSMIRAPLPRNFQALALLFLVGGIVAPVAEEIFFRGLVYGFFRRWGALLAVILSTALFAFAHSLRSVPFTQIVGGFLFAVAYEMEGNLLVPITVHVLGNLSIFALSALT
jgi:membrane protease YdiL (CAAX protease family)